MQNGCTALHLSSQEGHFDVVHALIEANAHVNQRSKVNQLIHVDCTSSVSVCMLPVFTLHCCLCPFASFFPSRCLSHYCLLPMHLILPQLPAVSYPTLYIVVEIIKTTIFHVYYTGWLYTTLLSLHERPCGSSSAAAPKAC